jgi:hypothetical protein
MKFIYLTLVVCLSIFNESYPADDCSNCEQSNITAVSNNISNLSNEILNAIPKNPNIDRGFIRKVQNKAFNFVRPAIADGEPNCVATALRAGNYLPAFALNGTDTVYENLLPICFSKQSPGEQTGGDLGIYYETKLKSLGHMFLFLDKETVFEKPSPQNTDLFQVNSLDKLQNAHRPFPDTKLEIWRYAPKPTCPLAPINKDFNDLPKQSLLKRVAKEMEERIASGDWQTPASTFTKNELELFVKEQNKKMDKWISAIPGGYKEKRDYPKFIQIQFQIDVAKAALRIPITK